MTARRVVISALVFNLLLIGVALALGLIKTGNPSRYFGEGRFTLAFSCGQLLLVAFFAIRTFSARRPVARSVGCISGAWVWAAVAAGFVFLALDDALEIHEKMDRIIHKSLNLRPTPLTDHIDDGIIALYGMIGLGVLWIFRRELLNFKVMLKPLTAGFVFLALDVVCDTLSNGKHLLLRLTGDMEIAKWLDGWLSFADGAFMLIAEGLFVAAFYLGSREARRSLSVATAGDRPRPAGELPDDTRPA